MKFGMWDYCCSRPSSDPPSSKGISGGWTQQERFVKSKLQKIPSFIVLESLDVPPEHTYIYILPAAKIRPKESREQRYLLFL